MAVLHQHAQLPPKVARTGPPALDVRNLSVSYGAAPIFEDVSFTLPAGQMFGLIGPIGAGKSTMLKAMLGLLSPDATRVTGKVFVGDRPLSLRNGRVAYVPQRDAINWRFQASVRDVVLMGRYGRLGWFRRPGPADHEIAHRSLEHVDMLDYASQPISDLSGGQQQRVFLARALAQDPDVLLLDEPISGVDSPTQESILRILAELAVTGKTILLTTHDLRCNMSYFDGLLAVNRSLVALDAVDRVLTPDVLAKTYGTQLVLNDGTHVSLI